MTTIAQELSNATGLPLDSNLIQHYAPESKAPVAEITEITKKAPVERKSK